MVSPEGQRPAKWEHDVSWQEKVDASAQEKRECTSSSPFVPSELLTDWTMPAYI